MTLFLDSFFGSAHDACFDEASVASSVILV